MSVLEGKPMGRVTVEVELANNGQIRDAERGRIPPEAVTRVKLVGVIDTGVMRLVLPQSVVDQLAAR